MIISFDFDGTLAVTDYPAIIKPRRRILSYAKRMKRKGNIIILNTCRHGMALIDALAWCFDNGLIFDYVNENDPEQIKKYGDCRKIYADKYIDDHNIKLLDYLKSF